MIFKFQIPFYVSFNTFAAKWLNTKTNQVTPQSEDVRNAKY